MQHRLHQQWCTFMIYSIHLQYARCTVYFLLHLWPDLNTAILGFKLKPYFYHLSVQTIEVLLFIDALFHKAHEECTLCTELSIK